MPYFSRGSLHKLRTCDPRLQALFTRVVEVYDCTIVTGHRGEAAQNDAFNSTPQRSKLPWPKGKHNAYPSKAVDAAPYPIDWGGPLVIGGVLNRKNLYALLRFYHFAAFVRATAREMGIPLRSGEDWDRDFDLNDQTFNDLGHFEIDER